MLGERRRTKIASTAHGKHLIELIVCIYTTSSEKLELRLAIILVASDLLLRLLHGT